MTKGGLPHAHRLRGWGPHLERVAAPITNPYGKDPSQRAHITRTFGRSSRSSGPARSMRSTADVLRKDPPTP